MEFSSEYSDCIELPPTLHVGCPNVGDRDLFHRLVDEIFTSRRLTNDGPVVAELESRLCEYLGVRHCVAVCNATLGLQLACRALELTGEVIVPSFTFVASAHALQWEGITPVFADVDPIRHTIDPDHVARLVTSRTTGILGVHLWGNPCHEPALAQIASNHGLRLFFDAAHAFGCGNHGRMVGQGGECEVFSFHATKFFNTLEGGAIATNDDSLAAKIRRMRSFGFAGVDHVVGIGTNAKMNEVCGAMGLSMFAHLDSILQCNRRHYLNYRDRLAGIDGIRLFSLDHLEHCNWQYIVVEIDESEFGCSRDDVMRTLHDVGVLARRYFYPGCHRMEPYRTLYRGRVDRLPVTERLCDSVLCLPTGSALRESDVDRVCATIRSLADAKRPLIRRAV